MQVFGGKNIVYVHNNIIMSKKNICGRFVCIHTPIMDIVLDLKETKKRKCNIYNNLYNAWPERLILHYINAVFFRKPSATTQGTTQKKYINIVNFLLCNLWFEFFVTFDPVLWYLPFKILCKHIFLIYTHMYIHIHMYTYV